MRPHRFLVLALDGVVDSSLALTLDAIDTANRVASGREGAARFEAEVFCPGRRRIRTGMGASFRVAPEVRIGRFDVVVIPGLGLATPAAVERFFASRPSAPAVHWLRTVGRRVPRVAASCSAVFLLAEAGLLDGRSATTTWWLSAAFRERYPEVDLDETRMVVESDGVLCAGAALAQIDLMLHLVARIGSPALARNVARYLAIEPRPSQARYMMLSAVAGLGDEVADVERWIRRHLSEAFSIADAARSLGMSPRTLDRRVRAATGQGASQLVQRLRLEHATHLIETTSEPLAEIAAAVGYADASTLRRLVRRQLGVTPSALRAASPD